MRVLHVYKDAYPPVVGGIEKHIDTLRRAMPDVESVVLAGARAWRGRRVSTDAGLDLFAPELGRVWSAPLAPAFPAWLARQPADVIHLHLPNPTGELALLLAQRRRPVVATYHADVVRQAVVLPLYRPVVRAALHRATRVILGSERMRARPVVQPFAAKIDVIPYGVDLARFDPGTVDAGAVRTIRERHGTPLVMAAGRLVYYKGFDLLVDAVRGLDASLVVVGAGPLADRLRARAAGAARVQFTGEVSDDTLVRLLAAADCFVAPATSPAEAFGISVIEAQAMGVPAIVTDVGTGTVEAIDPGVTGVVVEAGSAGAIRRALEALLTDSPARLAMAAAARRRATERHDATVMAERTRAVYEQAVA